MREGFTERLTLKTGLEPFFGPTAVTHSRDFERSSSTSTKSRIWSSQAAQRRLVRRSLVILQNGYDRSSMIMTSPPTLTVAIQSLSLRPKPVGNVDRSTPLARPLQTFTHFRDLPFNIQLKIFGLAYTTWRHDVEPLVWCPQDFTHPSVVTPLRRTCRVTSVAVTETFSSESPDIRGWNRHSLCDDVGHRWK